MLGTILTAEDVYRDMRIGFGPDLCRIMDSPGWTDIMINPDDENKVFLDESRQKEVPCRFDRRSLMSSALLLASYMEVPFNNTTDQVLDGVIPVVGYRANFVSPPAVQRLGMTIRKPSERVFSMEDMVKGGTITASQVEFLREAVERHANIVVAGGTSAGKTTLVNSIITMIDPSERLVVVEDVPELRFPAQPNVFKSLTNAHYTYNDGITAALRQRPDRIIIGECRFGRQALEMLKAWNTGHPGGITTLHANGAHEVFRRLDQLCSEVSVSSQMEMIREAVDVVIQMKRTRDNIRKVTELLDVREDRYIE